MGCEHPDVADDHVTLIPQWSKIQTPREVPVETCKKWIEQRSFVDPKGKTHELAMGGKTIISYEKVGETRPFESSDVQCYGGVYYTPRTHRKKEDVMIWESVSLELKEEELWVGDDNRVTVRSSNLRTSCTPEDLHCMTSKGTVYWKHMTPMQHCSFHIARRTSGVTVEDGHGRRVFLSNDGTMVRLTLKDHRTICGESAISTEFERLFLVEEHRKDKFHPQLPPDELSITMYIDAQDSFLYGYLTDYIQRSFRNMARRQCQRESRTQDRAMGALARAQRVHTDGAISADGEGYFFQFSGDWAFHYRCRPVVATGRDEPRCYNGLPVDLLKQDVDRHFAGLGLPVPHHTDETGRGLPILFLEPSTHRLTAHGIERPCSKQFPAGYLNTLGGWIEVLGGELHVTVSPTSLPERDRETLDDKGRPKPYDFSKGGIYDPETRDKYEQEVQERLRREEDIQTHISGQTHYRPGQGPIRSSDTYPDLPAVNLAQMFGPFLDVIDHVGRALVVFFILWFIVRLVTFALGMAARCWTAKSIFGCGWKLCLACLPSALDCVLVRAGFKASTGTDDPARRAARGPTTDNVEAIVQQPPRAGARGREEGAIPKTRRQEAESDIDFSTTGDEACRRVGEAVEARMTKSSSYRKLQSAVRRESKKLRQVKMRYRKKQGEADEDEISLVAG